MDNNSEQHSSEPISTPELVDIPIDPPSQITMNSPVVNKGVLLPDEEPIEIQKKKTLQEKNINKPTPFTGDRCYDFNPPNKWTTVSKFKCSLVLSSSSRMSLSRVPDDESGIVLEGLRKPSREAVKFVY